MNNHLIPQLLIDMVSDMKNAHPGAQLNYLRRLEAIQDYLNRELILFQAPKPQLPAQGQRKRR